MQQLIDSLRSIGEPTRLRVLALLAHGELAVGELVQILRLSQPRLSRHMKFLTAAGLVERLPEGAWVFYRLPSSGTGRALVDSVLSFVSPDDPEVVRDRENLNHVRAARKTAAEDYFNRTAESWDDVRGHHYPADDVESALLKAAGQKSYNYMVDFGTGTGRMISLFKDRFERAEGIDLSHKMLTIARSNLQTDDVPGASVRFGDVIASPFDDGIADLVTIHQVLHYMDQPGRVVTEAARVLKPGGRLMIVDFAPHRNEFLRNEHEHRHLGFEARELENWLVASGLKPYQPITLESQHQSGLAVTIWTADKLPKIGENAA